MQVLPFTIPKKSSEAILFQIDRGLLYNRLHQHREVQISLIKGGHGTLIAGESVHSFQKNDIVVLGGHQPHVFQSDPSGYLQSIFFDPNSFGEVFLSTEEGAGINDFYAFAKAGFKTKTTTRLTTLFDSLKTAKGLKKMSLFLQILDQLQQRKTIPLSTMATYQLLSEREGRRMQAIFEFTLSRFTQPITLYEVSKIAAMTPNAFCKFFKSRTNKTYFQFINDVRITHACRLLKKQPGLSIGDVASNSGFATTSHFNRSFKKIIGQHPTAFRIAVLNRH